MMVNGVFTLPWFKRDPQTLPGVGLGGVYTGANDLRDVNGAGHGPGRPQMRPAREALTWASATSCSSPRSMIGTTLSTPP